MPRAQYITIDDYIISFPDETRKKLEILRQTIKQEIPDAEETISYAIPTFKLNGKYVVYFAGFKNHISLYPITFPIENTLKEVSKYRAGKGTLQFPLTKPLPLPLIRKVVKLLLKENLKRTSKQK